MLAGGIVKLVWLISLRIRLHLFDHDKTDINFEYRESRSVHLFQIEGAHVYPESEEEKDNIANKKVMPRMLTIPRKTKL